MSESCWLPPSSTSVSVTAKTLELVNLYPLLLFLLFVITVFLFSSQPEYKIADPICTFLFSVLVVGTTLPITKDVFRILMEGKHWVFVMKISFSLTAGCAFVTPSVGFVFFPAGTPQDVHINSVRELLLSVRGVTAVHSLHMWSLNMTRSLLSVHVAAGRDSTSTAYLLNTDDKNGHQCFPELEITALKRLVSTTTLKDTRFTVKEYAHTKKLKSENCLFVLG